MIKSQVSNFNHTWQELTKTEKKLLMLILCWIILEIVALFTSIFSFFAIIIATIMGMHFMDIADRLFDQKTKEKNS